MSDEACGSKGASEMTKSGVGAAAAGSGCTAPGEAAGHAGARSSPNADAAAMGSAAQVGQPEPGLMYGQPMDHGPHGQAGPGAHHASHPYPYPHQASQQPVGYHGIYGYPHPGAPAGPPAGANAAGTSWPAYAAANPEAYAPYLGHPAMFSTYPGGGMPNQPSPIMGHAAPAFGNAAPGAALHAGAGQGPGPQAGMQQLFEELAEGGNGLSSLTRMLSLDDTEFWKGALVGAAAVLLLTNDQVQDALFKSGAKAKSAVKSGADQLKERVSTASGKAEQAAPRSDV